MFILMDLPLNESNKELEDGLDSIEEYFKQDTDIGEEDHVYDKNAEETHEDFHIEHFRNEGGYTVDF